jgi:copper chaperone
MRALSVATLTLAALTSGVFCKALSTRRAQLAQVMPTMGKSISALGSGALLIESSGAMRSGLNRRNKVGTRLLSTCFFAYDSAATIVLLPKGIFMFTFHVPDISCQHCVAAITQAVQAADAAARVQVSTESKAVQVESTVLDEEAIALAIAEAGYTVQIG